MKGLFFNDNIENFFACIQRPAKTQEQVFDSIREGISYVSEELCVGKMDAMLSVPPPLSEKEKVSRRTIFESGDPLEGTVQKEEFTTGDGGTAAFEFYLKAGCRWNQQIQYHIRFLSKQIFNSLSQVIMSGLLEHALVMDLDTQTLNQTGFFTAAEKLCRSGRIEEYDAFFLNIRNFKYVNKVLTYDQGSEIMKLYAEELKAHLEEEEVIARIGGDNYVVLVRQENVEAFLRNVRSIDVSYPKDGELLQFTFGATIGAAHLQSLNSVGDIMKRISIAYQVAREREDRSAVYYDENAFADVMGKKEILASFHKAMEKKEFVVYYQPKINIATGRICGAEALVRWVRNDVLIPPMEFIPTLEKDGSICELDFYVLNEVCRLLQKRRKEGKPLVTISVNFSRKHITDKDCVNRILEIINQYGIEHKYIEVELTESEDFRDYAVMSKLVEDLKRKEIGTSIDDFGTGYSSLNMLKRTRMDIIKIDKSFIPADADYSDKQKDMVMLKNIVQIARDLGMKTIVEGVETREQLRYVESMGCDMVQGFLFDKPLPEEEFQQRMEQEDNMPGGKSTYDGF